MHIFYERDSSSCSSKFSFNNTFYRRYRRNHWLQLKVPTKQEEVNLLAFFIWCFADSVIPSINRFEFSNDFMILIKSLVSSFEINKVNSFPTLTAPFALIFLSNLFFAFEGKLLTSPGKLSLVKGIATFVSFFA